MSLPAFDEIRYEPPETIGRFLDDHDSFVRGLMGPIGSGKSVGCAIDLMQISEEMPLDLRGRRRSRHAIVRNTYRELEDTTIRTVFEWFPQDEGGYGTHWSEKDHSWTVYDDVTGLETEWLFRALDRPDHVKKLLSLELTCAWVNEAREVPLAIINMLRGRLGRFPRAADYGWQATDEETSALINAMMNEGYIPIVGLDIPYWYGLSMDTNPPDDDHWWYEHFEELCPLGWKLYRQPSARGGAGENLRNLHPLYYHQLMQGQTDAWCKVYVDGDYGYVQEGKPVVPEYTDSVHTLMHDPEPVKGVEVVLGGDWGLTPAVVLMQYLQGSWVVFDEVVAERLGARNMANEVKQRLSSPRWRDCPVRQGWGDPSGGEGSNEIDEGETVFQVMRDAGLPFDPAPVADNDAVRRREAIAAPLTTLSISGRPRLLVCKRCKYVRKGLNGAYRYRRLQVAGDERYTDKPDKNAYSHPCEALGYALLGEGEGFELVGAAAESAGSRGSVQGARAQRMVEHARKTTKSRPRRIDVRQIPQ